MIISRKGFVILLSMFVFSLHGEVVGAEKDRYGIILPLTGEFAYVGMDIQKGLDECLKREGIINSVKINYQDNKSYSRLETVKAFKHMVTQGSKIIFLSVVPEVKTVESLALKAKVPVVVLWDKFRGKLPPNITSIGFSVEASAEQMAEFAFNTLKKRRVAIIAAIDEWAEVVTKSFSERFIKLGGKIVYKDEVNLQETNLLPVLLKAKTRKPDAFFLPMYSTSLSATLKQIKNLHLKQTILTPDGLTDSVIKEIGEYAEGVYTYRPLKPAFGELPPGRSGFYGMGLSACKVIKHYMETGTILKGPEPHLQTMGIVREGRWKML